MPTPSGLLKGGDRIHNIRNPGVVYEVLQRTSSSEPYGIWLRRIDGHRITELGGFDSREGGREIAFLVESWNWLMKMGWRLDQHLSSDVEANAAKSLDDVALASRLRRIAGDIRWATVAERAALLQEAAFRLERAQGVARLKDTSDN